MNWKHTLISAATLANLLLIVLPGLGLVLEVVNDVGAAADPLESLAWLVYGLFGLGMMAVGICNILCVQLVFFRPGSRQRFVYKAGLISCGLMVVVALLITAASGRFLGLILVGIVAPPTIMAMRRVQPELQPGWECPSCGYDLRGIESMVCPECGADLDDDETT